MFHPFAALFTSYRHLRRVQPKLYETAGEVIHINLTGKISLLRALQLQLYGDLLFLQRLLSDALTLLSHRGPQLSPLALHRSQVSLALD